MIPPNASTSRTTVPFATPPIAGLHDICPIVSSALVTIATRAPLRAAATAASVPAWPAPTTITSNSASNAFASRASIRESYGRRSVSGSVLSAQAVDDILRVQFRTDEDNGSASHHGRTNTVDPSRSVRVEWSDARSDRRTIGPYTGRVPRRG